MPPFDTAQIRLQNTGYEFLVGSVDDQHNPFLQEFIVYVRRCLFQLKKTFFSGHIRQINDRMYYLALIALWHF